MRQRVSLRHAAFVGDIFVPASEGHRLEGKKVDLLGVVESKLDDAPDLLVIDAIDNAGDGNDVHAGFMQVMDGLKLDVERIADLAMRVGCIADAVKLEVGVAKTRLSSSLRKLYGLGKLDAVGRSLNRGVSDLACVSYRVQKVRAERGFTTGELH